MDLYKHKSGAQKQKDKEKKHENEKKGQQSLFHVGVKSKKPECVLEAKVVSALHRKLDKDDTKPTVSTLGNYNLSSEMIPNADSNSNPSQTDFVLLSNSSNIVDQNTNLESDILDFGDLPQFPNIREIESFVAKGPQTIYSGQMQNDGKRAFHWIVLHTKTKNGEFRLGDWLTWCKKQ